jgi:hypothetical protein
MKEGDFTSLLLRTLKAHPSLQGAVIFKHSDFYTMGVPDFTITIRGRTTWWEVKVHPNKPTKIQQFYIDALKPVSYVIVAKEHGGRPMNSEITVSGCGLGWMKWDVAINAIVVYATSEELKEPVRLLKEPDNEVR